MYIPSNLIIHPTIQAIPCIPWWTDPKNWNGSRILESSTNRNQGSLAWNGKAGGNESQAYPDAWSRVKGTTDAVQLGSELMPLWASPYHILRGHILLGPMGGRANVSLSLQPIRRTKYIHTYIRMYAEQLENQRLRSPRSSTGLTTPTPSGRYRQVQAVR